MYTQLYSSTIDWWCCVCTPSVRVFCSQFFQDLANTCESWIEAWIEVKQHRIAIRGGLNSHIWTMIWTAQNNRTQEESRRARGEHLFPFRARWLIDSLGRIRRFALLYHCKILIRRLGFLSRQVLHFYMCKFLSGDKNSKPKSGLSPKQSCTNKSRSMPDFTLPWEVTLGSSTDTSLGHNQTKIKQKGIGEIFVFGILKSIFFGK